MKYLPIVLLMVLAGCQAHIQIDWTDPDTGAANTVIYESARKAAITMGGVTVITGEVVVDSQTVLALGRQGLACYADPL